MRPPYIASSRTMPAKACSFLARRRKSAITSRVSSCSSEKHGKEDKVLGCVALEPYGSDLAEIRSLAVAPDARGQGRNVGDRLMKAAMDTARRRKIARLFAVTHRPEFFSRYGFTPGPRQTVPEKIERDCATCPKERKCNLIATVAVVSPERDLLTVLNGAGKALSVA